MVSRRGALFARGPSVPDAAPPSGRCGAGGGRGLADGRSRRSAELERGLETVSEGSDISDAPGGGATVEGGAAVLVGTEASV